MSNVTINPPSSCDVCGKPATAALATFAEDHSPIPSLATILLAFCDAHVPADWHIGEPRNLEPPAKAQPGK